MAIENIRKAVRRLPGYSPPATGRPRVKLDQNESPFDLPSDLKEEVLGRLRTRPWNRYPVYGNPSLRDKLAERIGVSADQLLLAHGSNQIICSLTSAVLGPGDRVVISPPTFSLFELVARIAEAEIVRVPQKPNFRYDAPAIREAAADARVVILASPNSPTGAALDVDDLDKIASGTSGLVLWDEAYHEFWGKSALPLLRQHKNLLILRTFSKAYGLAGVRLGYLVGDARLVSELRKVNVPYNVDCLSETVLEVVLDHPELVGRCVRVILDEKRRLQEVLARLPEVEVFPSETNFLLLRFRDGELAYRALLGRGVYVRSFLSTPGLQGCLRVTVGSRQENDAFLTALAEVLNWR